MERIDRLAPQPGDVARHTVVRGGGIEADEPALPADLSVGVKLPDAYVVGIARPVHRGSRIGPRNHQQLGALPVALARRRQVRERLGGVPAFVAQQPEPRPRLRHEPVTASGALDSIIAEPQEREVVVLDPFEEGAHLVELVAIDRRRRRLQIFDAPAQLLAHAAPILDRHPDVVERGTNLHCYRIEHLLLGLAIDLDVDDRLDDGSFACIVDGEERVDAAVLPPAKPHHGVNYEVARVRAAVQHHAHRVDQERHVVGDDLDDGMGRLPAVLLDLGVVDPDLRLPGRAPPGEVEVRRRGAVEIVRLAFGEVVGRGARVVPVTNARTRSRSSPLTRSRASAATSSISSICCVFG